MSAETEQPDVLIDAAASADAAARKRSVWARLLKNTSVVVGGVVLIVMVLVALTAPFLGTIDPIEFDPGNRNKRPGAEALHVDAEGNAFPWVFKMGTDTLGRDTYSRVIYGTQVSLAVGFTVAIFSILIGTAVGLIAGYIRWLGGLVMRVMDGMMAIPGILLAIALVSLWSAGLDTVILAITIPEVPRVVRLVRSIVLSIREEPYVEAAISVGTPTVLIMLRHVLPNTVAPLIVQGTYIVASAILLEAILSFLGVGIPPEIPTWGNIMAEGRVLFQVFPHNSLFPGIFLAVTVLAVNILGDGLRDTLDPRLEKRG